MQPEPLYCQLYGEPRGDLEARHPVLGKLFAAALTREGWLIGLGAAAGLIVGLQGLREPLTFWAAVSLLAKIALAAWILRERREPDCSTALYAGILSLRRSRLPSSERNPRPDLAKTSARSSFPLRVGTNSSFTYSSRQSAR